MILVANTTFPELDQLAAALADAGILSRYIRPYARLEGRLVRSLEAMPAVGLAYKRLFSRRKMPQSLSRKNVQFAGIAWDFAMALHTHSRIQSIFPKQLNREVLTHARTQAVARAAERAFQGEQTVVGARTCAELIFRRATKRGTRCILNFPIAHHRFARRFLLEEAERQPAFAGTLNNHNLPVWLEDRIDAEIELADQILVGSSFVQNSFLAEGIPDKKLVTIPYGVDTQLFDRSDEIIKDHKDFRVLFVGQISQRKGLSYLLSAYQRFHGPGTTLTMVGHIQGDSTILNRYSHLISYIPHVPRPELRQIYRKADVFVFPTLIEGMPLVVLEAMASGLPVITTPNGPGDIVRDGVDGFLVPPRDVDALIERMVRLKDDPDLRAKMGFAARERAQSFTWEAYRKKALSVITNNFIK